MPSGNVVDDPSTELTGHPVTGTTNISMETATTELPVPEEEPVIVVSADNNPVETPQTEELRRSTRIRKPPERLHL